MSQEKVSRYKEEKANRKSMMKKEKRKHFFRKCVVGIVALAWLDGLDILHIACMKAADHARQQK